MDFAPIGLARDVLHWGLSKALPHRRPEAAGCRRDSDEDAILLLRLWNLLRGGSVFLFCGVSFGLFLRRLLVSGFWRFVTHDPHVMIRDPRSQYGQIIQDQFPRRIRFLLRLLGPTSLPRASTEQTLPRRTHALPNGIADPTPFPGSIEKCALQPLESRPPPPEFHRN
jgi:hypothetical protein